MHQRPVGHSPGTNGSLTLDQLVIAQGPDGYDPVNNLPWTKKKMAINRDKFVKKT